MRDNRTFLYLGAAVCTGIAGILHIVLVPNSILAGIEYAAFFLISGVAQLFWVLPMIKRWGKIWYIIGAGGTAILVGLTGYALANMAADPQATPPRRNRIGSHNRNIPGLVCCNHGNNNCQETVTVDTKRTTSGQRY